MQTDGGGGGGSNTISPYSIGDVAATLDAIDVDPETIDAIVTILRQSRDGIGDRVFEDIPENAFGASPAGGNLGYHTRLAHQKIVDAMDQMMTEITEMETGVVEYQRSQEYNDIEARLQMEQLVERLSQVLGWRAV